MTNERTYSPKDSLFHTSVRFKQQAAIDKLKKDNDELKEELLLANKVSVRPTRHSSVMRIAQLQDEADTLTRKIELEKRKIGMLDMKMEELQGKITTLRKSMGGITASRDADRVLEKQIKVLENRLEKAFRKYSEGLTKNRRLREMIDNLRRERLMLESINVGLEKERDNLQREMTNILKNTNAMHEARDNAFEEMSKLKSRSEKKQMSFEKEWAELTGVINDDREAQETKRIQELEERERKTQELLKSTQDREEIRKTLKKGSWSSEKRNHEKNEVVEELQKYNLAFEQIRNATGVANIDELIEQVVETEDENYTLFNYIQELDKDIEALGWKISVTTDSLATKENECQSNDLEESSREMEESADAVALEKGSVQSGERNELEDTLINGATSLLNCLTRNSVKSEEITGDIVEAQLGKAELLIDSLVKEYLNQEDKSNFTEAVQELVPPIVHFSVAPPSTQQEESEHISLEAFDEERPWLGGDLRAIVASLMKHKVLDKQPSTGSIL